MSDDAHITFRASSLDVLPSSLGLIPTGDPYEYFFGKGTDRPAVIEFYAERGGYWSATVFAPSSALSQAIAVDLAARLSEHGLETVAFLQDPTQPLTAAVA